LRKSVIFDMPALINLTSSLFSASSEFGHCTAAPQVTVTSTPNTFTASAADADDAHDNACPAIFVQKPHPLDKFKELAMRR
jgi:hypothetical protein